MHAVAENAMMGYDGICSRRGPDERLRPLVVTVALRWVLIRSAVGVDTLILGSAHRHRSLYL